MLDKVELCPDFYEIRPYRQPSFQDIMNKADELESPNRIRFLNFPVELEEIARNGLEEHLMYSKSADSGFTGTEGFKLRMELDDIRSQKYNEAYQSLSKRKQREVKNHGWSSELAEKIEESAKQELYARLGSTAQKEYDPSDAVTKQYEKWWGDHGGGSMVHRNSKIAMQHIRGVCKGQYDDFVARMKKVQELRPWLIEFSDKYHDVFQGVTFVGNGYRAIEGSEGLVFFKPEREYGGTFKVSPDIEKEFVESITDVVPLGEHRRPRDKVHLDLNGCRGKMETFWIQLNGGGHGTIAYLDRDFGSFRKEGWLMIANPFDKDTVEQHRKHPWSDLE